MNEIERLNGDLARSFPGLRIEPDPPAVEPGSWHLNLFRAGGLAPVVVEWRADRGFGVTTPGPDDHGAGQLVLSGGDSVPAQDAPPIERRRAAR